MIKLNWKWFLGGSFMFWVSIVLIAVLVFSMIFTYAVDPIRLAYMKDRNNNTEQIEQISNDYLNSYGIKIENIPIKYRFVRYNDKGYEAAPGTSILLGTFHAWNNTYYIDISVDLYNTKLLDSIVKHETRHMIVDYLCRKKIIDLNKYTEEIASCKNSYYDEIFNNSIELLKLSQKT